MFDPAALVGNRSRLATQGRYKSGGRLWQDYKVGKTVARNGGTASDAAVRLVTARGDGRSYAAKSFSKTGLSEERAELLRSEVAVCMSVDHPHIARVHEVLETTDELHIVMENMAGGELYQRLQARRQFSEAEAAAAARQMLLAVAYLHAHRVAHRDLKLENFMYEAAGSDHLKLIDFGLAQHWGSGPQAELRNFCGSVHYIAPEVVQKDFYTEKADMWSLGIIVYTLLAGTTMYDGRDEQEILRKIQSGEHQFSPRFPAHSALAKDFVKQLLAFDPESRPSAADALRHPWILEHVRPKEQRPSVDSSSVTNLCAFARASPRLQVALEAASLAITTEDREVARPSFQALAAEDTGTIARSRVRSLLVDGGSDETEVETVLEGLGMGQQDAELEYGKFVAASLYAQRLDLGNELLRRAFTRYAAAGCAGAAPGAAEDGGRGGEEDDWPRDANAFCELVRDDGAELFWKRRNSSRARPAGWAGSQLRALTGYAALGA